MSRAELPEILDLLVVGAGPAGTAAAFRARELGLQALVIDFDDVLKRIRDYPKDKLILPDFGGGDRMAFPAGDECISGLQFEAIDKDEICARWKQHYSSFGVPVVCSVELTGLQPAGHGWDASTWNHGTREPGLLHARHVVLAIGRGVPRRFDIPGNTDGIAYRLDDAGNYVSGPVCVIGGGTSAAEAVIAISKAKIQAVEASHVFWSYRGSKMPRVSKALADEFFEAYIGNGNIRYHPNSEPVGVVTAPDRVEYLSLRVDRRMAADRPPETLHLEFQKTRCIACIGEDIPEAFLRQLGIAMVPAAQNRKMCVVSPLLETQQRNVYLIGDLLSQVYLETDDFGAPPDQFRQVKHRGNIKSSLRDGVFVAEVIRQKLDGQATVNVVIRDAEPVARATPDAGIARISAALGLAPERAAAAGGAAVGDAPGERAAILVSLTPTGVDAENFTLRTDGVTTIGRVGCDVSFAQDTALSENHASISHRDGAFHLRDDGSRSGTYLRLRPEAPLTVQPGALLRAGRQILVASGDAAGLFIDHYDATSRPVARYPLGTNTVVFGRRGGPSQPDVALDDRDLTLSRFHFAATARAMHFVLQDLGSRNGTYLRIDGEQRLEHNDLLRVGNQLFQIRLREDLPEKSGSMPVVQPAQPAAPPGAPPPPAASPSAAGPHITFQGQNIAGAADAAETLLTWADAHGVAMDYECWMGMCGCDVIRIVQGAEHLNEVTDKEKKTLGRKGLAPGEYRLACMTRCSGPVVVEVRSS